MMLKFRFFTASFILFFFIKVNIFAVDGTFVAKIASETPVIDGIGNESFWADAEWYPLNQVWLPYNDVVEPNDFTGRFKLSWNENRLLLLVEIVDDSLNDGHVDPFNNYWNDDCVEVFIDENHSGGDYRNTFKAFAYHVGINFDVVNPWSNVLLNDHIQAAKIIHDSLYTWELSIKIFKDTYTASGPNSPVTLSNNKEMGFSLAYCDNDKSPERENFIGSKYLPGAQSNDSYFNSSLFGTLTLKDPAISSNKKIADNTLICTFYPNPAKNFVNYQFENIGNGPVEIKILNQNGQALYNKISENQSGMGIIPISGIAKGIYFMQIVNANLCYTSKLVIL
jgi:hypothetical protein